jgi:hypothetical protein
MGVVRGQGDCLFEESKILVREMALPTRATASNAATTARPSTGSNPKKSGLHSVGIGALRESTMNCCGTTVFVDLQPRCTQ